MQLREDLRFADRYKFHKLLGRGGFSEVWLANDEWTNLDVAVKVYAPGLGMDEDGLRDFCKELSNVYNMNHTNLLKPQHVDTWEGMPYLIMPYCEKGSCYRQVGKFTEEEAWKLIADVASGLSYLHAQNVIHQDIKPDNILVDSNGNYVITDFGISVKARSTLRKSSRQASSGGTTAYMAPERFSRDAAPVKASDIWSLGATVYELITGKVPFGEVGGGMQRGGAEIPTINAKISSELRQAITRMLAEDPWQRPVASQLADWARNPSVINHQPRSPKTGLVIILVVIAIALGAFGVWKFVKSNGGKEGPGGIPPEVVHEKLCKEFDFRNKLIFEENTLTDTTNVIEPLIKLKEIERMENNPDFARHGISPVFSVKLKAYRENLGKALKAVNAELINVQAYLNDEDRYVKRLLKKKNQIEKILDQSNNGSVMAIDIREL